MPSYTLLIGGVEQEFMEVTITNIHPNADCDLWSATLPFNVNLADEAEVEIQRDGTTIFKGLLEERELEMSARSGVLYRVGGRHTKVKVWRNWIERNEDPKSGGFWFNYYPHRVVQFYIYPSASDVHAYHRSGWGVSPEDWTITTNPAGSNPARVKDRFITLGWESGANQANGHYVEVDLGSAKTICAIRVEDRMVNDTDFAENYKIQRSANGAWGGEEVDLVTVTSNAANNIVHAWTPVSARYWRILLTAAADPVKEWSVGEIYLYETDGTMTGISEGTLTAHDKLDEKIDFTYMRRTDAIQKITDLTETANVKWEWWVTDDGVVNFAARRGSDKSATVNFTYSSNLASTSYKRDSKQKVERVLVLGKGKGNVQDVDASSGWVGTGEYEKVIVEKELADDAACTARANILVNELNTPIVTIRCEVEDLYPTGSWEVGDDVTLTDSTTGLTGAYRVKKVSRKFNDDGEQVVIEASNSYKTVVNLIAGIRKELDSLKISQDQYGSIDYREVGETYYIDGVAQVSHFIDNFDLFNTNIWTEAGVNSVTPDIQIVDNEPCLRIRTAGATNDSTNIYTTNLEWTSLFRWETKLKLAQISDVEVYWGLGDGHTNADNGIFFRWDSAQVGGELALCECDGVGLSVQSSGYLDSVDVTEWHIYRIDWVDSTQAKFYIDGILVGTHTTGGGWSIPQVTIPLQFEIVTTADAAKTFYVRSVVGRKGPLE